MGRARTSIITTMHFCIGGFKASRGSKEDEGGAEKVDASGCIPVIG